MLEDYYSCKYGDYISCESFSQFDSLLPSPYVFAENSYHRYCSRSVPTYYTIWRSKILLTPWSKCSIRATTQYSSFR